MSRTAIIGNLGVGKQSVKGTAASSFTYLPATSINVNTQQQTQALPPEIGGTYFLRGAYKSNAAVAGDVSMILRPDGTGYLLDMLCGNHTTVTNHGATGGLANPSSAPSRRPPPAAPRSPRAPTPSPTPMSTATVRRSPPPPRRWCSPLGSRSASRR
jgi:hypothetical protein